MKAQHPPHIPSNAFEVAEYFRSLPRSREGGGGCHEELVAPRRPPAAWFSGHGWQKKPEKTFTWTNSRVGTWGYLHQLDGKLKSRLVAQWSFTKEKKRIRLLRRLMAFGFKDSLKKSRWEHLSGQNTFIYAPFNLTEVSTTSLRRRHDYVTQWEEGKEPLSWVNLFYNRKCCWFTSKKRGVSLFLYSSCII